MAAVLAAVAQMTFQVDAPGSVAVGSSLEITTASCFLPCPRFFDILSCCPLTVAFRRSGVGWLSRSLALLRSLFPGLAIQNLLDERKTMY